MANPRSLATTVNYYGDPWDGSPPMPVYVGRAQVINERPMVATKVVVEDVTGIEYDFTLDTHGFQYHRYESKEKSFDDEAKLREEYFPECERLIQDMTGAARVLVFDHRVRRGPSYWHKLGVGNTKSRGPLHRAHVDQSYYGAELKLREHLAGEADELVKKRWQIINVWRPIKTIFKDPLALADARSVSDDDLVEATIVYPDKEAKSWTVKANLAHRWFFKYAQQPDEVVLIKCFDSQEDVAQRAPHCAVEDPVEVENECRESVEVRCFVFYDD